MSTNYHDMELDLATLVCEKSALLLQSPGDRFEKRDAEGDLWLLMKLGCSADKRKAIGDLAQFSSDFAEPGQDVLLTEASHSGAPALYPKGFVHGTDGDYGHDQGEASGDDDEHGGLHGDDGPCAYYPDGGGASPGMPIGPMPPVRNPGVAMGLLLSGTNCAIASTTRALRMSCAARAAPS